MSAVQLGELILWGTIIAACLTGLILWSFRAPLLLWFLAVPALPMLVGDRNLRLGDLPLVAVPVGIWWPSIVGLWMFMYLLTAWGRR